MAEALFDLGGDVSWSPAAAPRGELVLLQDSGASSGAFLVHHFVSLFLKAGEPERRLMRSIGGLTYWRPQAIACAS